MNDMIYANVIILIVIFKFFFCLFGLKNSRGESFSSFNCHLKSDISEYLIFLFGRARSRGLGKLRTSYTLDAALIRHGHYTRWPSYISFFF